jgi:hypothetical protein
MRRARSEVLRLRQTLAAIARKGQEINSGAALHAALCAASARRESLNLAKRGPLLMRAQTLQNPERLPSKLNQPTVWQYIK